VAPDCFLATTLRPATVFAPSESRVRDSEPSRRCQVADELVVAPASGQDLRHRVTVTSELPTHLIPCRLVCFAFDQEVPNRLWCSSTCLTHRGWASLDSVKVLVQRCVARSELGDCRCLVPTSGQDSFPQLLRRHVTACPSHALVARGCMPGCFPLVPRTGSTRRRPWPKAYGSTPTRSDGSGGCPFPSRHVGVKLWPNPAAFGYGCSRPAAPAGVHSFEAVQRGERCFKHLRLQNNTN